MALIERIFLGIDPGQKGAYVMIDGDRNVLDADFLPYAGKALEVRRLNSWVDGILKDWDVSPDRLAAVLEALGSRPSPKMGASSAITMGRNWGRLDGWLTTRRTSYDVIQPKKWQAVVCPGGGDPKARSILAAQRLFPKLDLAPGARRKPSDGIADAACMAEYARRVGVNHGMSLAQLMSLKPA